MSSNFADKLAAAVVRNRSLLCVGLDPDPFQFPQFFRQPVDAEALAAWGRAIIEQTADLVCCYKPNSAFYEQFGSDGLDALRQTLAAVPEEVPVLLDAKRGDIGSTATAYARAAFDVLGVDAVTVSPYLGQDAVAPFLAYAGKAAFVLCYTSNPSAAAIQEFGDGKTRLFEHIVNQATHWGGPDQIGLVVGATQPEALARVRGLLGGRPHVDPCAGRGRAGRQPGRSAGCRPRQARQRVDPTGFAPCHLRRRPPRRRAGAAGSDQPGSHIGWQAIHCIGQTIAASTE